VEYGGNGKNPKHHTSLFSAVSGKPLCDENYDNPPFPWHIAGKDESGNLRVKQETKVLRNCVPNRYLEVVKKACGWHVPRSTYDGNPLMKQS
jgi:hypothetical protein